MKTWKKTCTTLFLLLAIVYLLGALAAIGCYFGYDDIAQPPEWADVPDPGVAAKKFLAGGIECLLMSVGCFVATFLVRGKAKGIIVSLIITVGVIILEIVEYLTMPSSDRVTSEQVEIGLICGVSLALIYFIFQRLKAVRAELHQIRESPLPSTTTENP